MNKSGVSTLRPIRNLRVIALGERDISLRHARGEAHVSVLAPDLFRVRFSAGKLSKRPSWAVCKTQWKDFEAKTQTNRKGFSIKTSRGALGFELATGAWTLADASGNEIFCCAGEGLRLATTGWEVRLQLEENESLFGLGETTGTFNKRGLVREFWNIDVLGHAPAIHPSLRTLYVSIPFAISIREGRAAGIFWDNPCRQYWDLGQTDLDRWEMKAYGGELDLYLFVGPSVQGVVSRFTELTGRIALPPIWGLGYQQCRYSYDTWNRVEELAKTFRRKQIPCDVIYLDIHHMDEYRVFTFGKDFSKAAQRIAKLVRDGFKVVTIVDPGVKDDPQFGVLQRGIKRGAFVKSAGGKSDFIGKVWPGESRFPDFLTQRAREWWGEEQSELQRLGVAGFWNDMNEPANFGFPTKTLPEDCEHASDFGQITHAEGHNVYGMQMARASAEGAVRARQDERPFVISRAGYAGVQRYAIIWTGDNSSVWEHLSDSIQMYLNLSLSGVAFCGGDVGGFIDNATSELLVRWMQMAAFTPFFRNHSNIRTIDQEPWAFGERTEAICRKYIELRYQLLPYLYHQFVEAHRYGTPIMRPLLWHYQDDPVAVAVSDQFLLGSDLLVAPVLRQGAVARSVYLPKGAWFNFWSGERVEGGQHIVAQAPLDLLPLFVRAGGTIPICAVQQFIGEKNQDLVNLHLWPGASSDYTWYEDDGTSMAYTRGGWHQRLISVTRRGRDTVICLVPPEGKHPTAVKRWRFILREQLRPVRVRVKQREQKARFDRGARLCAFEIPNSSDPIEIRISES